MAAHAIIIFRASVPYLAPLRGAIRAPLRGAIRSLLEIQAPLFSLGEREIIGEDHNHINLLSSYSTDPESGNILLQEEFEERVKQLTMEWNSTRSKPKLRILMADTRANRREIIGKGMPVSDVVKTFPVFKDGSYIMDEFCSIINLSNPSEAREMIEKRTNNLFKIVRQLANISEEGAEDDSIRLLDILEKKVAVVKGKGTRSKTVMTMLEVEEIDVSDDVLAKKLHVKDKSPLALRIVCMDGSTKMIFIVGEGQFINCQSVNAKDALIQLLGAYYIFHLNYPAIYGQLLGFLQQQILEQPYPFFKGTLFQTFSTKVKNAKQ